MTTESKKRASLDDAAGSDRPAAKKPHLDCSTPVLIAGAASDAGKKTVNEDRWLITDDLYAVFDGHGGHQVSDYLLHHFPSALETERTKGGAMKPILNATFKSLDVDILNTIDEESGSCAAVCVRDSDTFWVANVGDCRAVLARRSTPDAKTFRAIPLSKEHMPIYAAESQRIKQAGGFVENGRVNGRLEVSRAFGDKSLKRAGVICTPYVCHFKFKPETDSFIVMACDGLWKVMESQAVVDFIVEKLENPDTDSNRGDNLARYIARLLLTHVVMEKYAKDNVTIIIILFTVK